MNKSLPPGWRRVRLGDVLEPVNRFEKLDPEREYRLLGVKWYAQGVFERERKFGKAIAAKQLNRIEEGDFVYNRLFAWKGSFAVVGNGHAGGYVSGEFPVFRAKPDAILAEFLYRHFSRPQAWRLIEHHSTGTTNVSRNRWREEQFLSWHISLPPLSEQERIVVGLRTVDDAILASEEVVSRARGLKRMIAHKLLTEGMPDRHTRFKNSPGGRIPAEWETKPLLEVSSYQNGRAFPSEEFGKGSMKLLRPGNLYGDGRVIWDEEHTTTLPDKYSDLARDWVLRGGELVMNLTAQSLADEFLGRVCWTPEGTQSLLNQRLARFRSHGCELRYLFWSLKGPVFRRHINRLPKGSKVQHIYNRDIESFVIPLPSSTEQRAIADVLDAISQKEWSETDRLPLLLDLKSRLLSALLGG